MTAFRRALAAALCLALTLALPVSGADPRRGMPTASPPASTGHPIPLQRRGGALGPTVPGAQTAGFPGEQRLEHADRYFSAQARPIAEALKRYGMILADNGSDWFISGASDPRIDDDVPHELDVIHGSDLEAVDTSSLVNGP